MRSKPRAGDVSFEPPTRSSQRPTKLKLRLVVDIFMETLPSRLRTAPYADYHVPDIHSILPPTHAIAEPSHADEPVSLSFTAQEESESPARMSG